MCGDRPAAVSYLIGFIWLAFLSTRGWLGFSWWKTSPVGEISSATHPAPACCFENPSARASSSVTLKYRPSTREGCTPEPSTISWRCSSESGLLGGAMAFGRGTLSGAIMRIVVFEVLGDSRYWGRGGCQAHFFCFVQKKGQGCHTV